MVSRCTLGAMILSAGIVMSLFLMDAGVVHAESVCVKLTHDLQIDSSDGTTDGEVTKLQRFLGQQDSSIYPTKDPEGYFGPDTKLAVYRWQKSRGIKTEAGSWGFVDAKTRAAMAICKQPVKAIAAIPAQVKKPAAVSADFSVSECSGISRGISRGSTGTDVVILQKFLTTQYSNFLSSYVTGSFGPTTEAALKQWQKEQGIVSSGSAGNTGYGSVGPRTRDKIREICNTPYTEPSAAEKPSGSYIKCLNTAPISCPSGFVPGGTCNLQCIFDTTPPPQWVLDINNSPVVPVAPVNDTNTVAPVVTPPPGSTGASTLSATVSAGTPLTVAFSGSYDPGSSCDGVSYEINYGDGNSDALPSTCAPSGYSKVHTYASAGTYFAYILKVTANNGQPLYDSQIQVQITIAQDGSIQIGTAEHANGMQSDPYTNLASVLIALESALAQLLEKNPLNF